MRTKYIHEHAEIRKRHLQVIVCCRMVLETHPGALQVLEALLLAGSSLQPHCPYSQRDSVGQAQSLLWKYRKCPWQ